MRRNLCKRKELSAIKGTENKEQRIKISTYQKSCIMEYTVSDRLKFSVLCFLFLLLCGAPNLQILIILLEYVIFSLLEYAILKAGYIGRISRKIKEMRLLIRMNLYTLTDMLNLRLVFVTYASRKVRLIRN